MRTIKELADIGAAAAFANNKYHHYMSVSRQSHSWESDEPARQAFALAVKEAVEKPLLAKITTMAAEIAALENQSDTKPDSSPKWQLPDPPEGREWHRSDWTEALLPEGWRPLLKGEKLEVGDWTSVVRDVYGCAGETPEQHQLGLKTQAYCRTTRPLPPVTKTIPLDMGDIRATDEFQPCGEARQLCTLRHANENGLSLLMHNGMIPLTYEKLATHYLRRQHGSDEWKPCTKEITL